VTKLFYQTGAKIKIIKSIGAYETKKKYSHRNSAHESEESFIL
jgi:hypothetical protein